MDIQQLFNTILEHWLLLAAAGMFYTLGQMFKAAAPGPETNKFWNLAWRLLPFHPFLAGLVLGIIPGVPVPEVIAQLGGIVRFMYYAAAGVLATYGHDIYQTWQKHKPGQE